jgi:hypothetical protein
MTKFTARVIIDVEITLDEAKFDEAFMSEFRRSFYQFHDIEEHAEHLAQLQARGLLDFFTEGYGEIKAMGIDGKEIAVTVEDLTRVGAKEVVSHD